MTVIASSLSTLIESKKHQKSKSNAEVDEVWKTAKLEWEWIGGDERRAGLVLSVPKSEFGAGPGYFDCEADFCESMYN